MNDKYLILRRVPGGIPADTWREVAHVTAGYPRAALDQYLEQIVDPEPGTDFMVVRDAGYSCERFTVKPRTEYDVETVEPEPEPSPDAPPWDDLRGDDRPIPVPDDDRPF